MEFWWITLGQTVSVASIDTSSKASYLCVIGDHTVYEAIYENERLLGWRDAEYDDGEIRFKPENLIARIPGHGAT